MTLEDVLKTTNSRLSLYGKWLVWDDFMHWNVYQAKPYARKSQCLISTQNLEIAIEKLIEDSK